MNQDQVKGTIDDVAGRVKRQIGEWTGDLDAQVEGAAQQLQGKARKALGDAKEVVQAVHEKLRQSATTSPAEDQDFEQPC